MQPYYDLITEVLRKGSRQSNRTGIDTIRLPYGSMMRYDMNDGFPLETRRRMTFKGCKGELVGFLRAAESAADFRALGCNFWNQNANENKAWLANPLRKGEDDLGRIYGAQWRRWLGDTEFRVESHLPESERSPFRVVQNGKEFGVYMVPFDQIKAALETIHTNPTDRGIIINAWRPDEFRSMALRPCHVLYQFTVDVQAHEISLCMYQRSADMFLGVPMNIASSALLLKIFGHLTGYKPRYFTHFIDDAHIYVNHLDQVNELLARTSFEAPTVRFSERIKPYDGKFFNPHLIDAIGPEDIILENYQSHDAISAPMAV
jgi:thymidylate synthase